jgi:hypothetical protein
LDLADSVKHFKSIIKLKSAVPPKQEEEFIILAYLEKTGVYKKLRDILYDVYYGIKFPNPLARISTKIEQYSYKKQTDKLVIDDVNSKNKAIF